ncbi:hypothetical protein ACIHFE_09500 [Streptomyces sp. NPDC052396]|uniref:hypothetical protein n=1 Tax=Streptomyces sp. NPDC052396 TaxID=3365689 RepID=UPI0037CE7680
MTHVEKRLAHFHLGADAGLWLVSREPHPREAREAWMRDAPAMLRIGVHFDAVRLPASVVHRAAGGAGREVVEAAFRRAGIEGAVIVDHSGRWYYALVPPGTAAGWREEGCEALGEGCYLGVPGPYRAEPPGSYWLLTPPGGEADLCEPRNLRELSGHGVEEVPRPVWGRRGARDGADPMIDHP